MEHKTYDPQGVILTFGHVQVLGYAAGEFISVERAEDSFTVESGAAGDTVRVKNRSKIGTVKVVLLAASLTNESLSAIAKEDELFLTGVRALMMKNLNGTTLVQSANSWIRKLPALPFSDGVDNREWNFDCASLQIDVGGSVI